MMLFKQKHRKMFPGQQPGEHIYLITRPHWLVLAKQIGAWVIFGLVYIYLENLLLPIFPQLAEETYLPALNLLKSVYLMFLLASLFSIWIVYYLNYQIVTNERAVDIDQYHLLSHQTSELHLVNIEDVTAEIKGLLGTMFDYGNVYVQTAGQVSRFEFEKIPHPHKVANLMLDLYEKSAQIEKTQGRPQ